MARDLATTPVPRFALASVGLALGLLIALTGCTPSAAPEPSASATAIASATASPAPAPVALPACDAIYSPELVATLGRSL